MNKQELGSQTAKGGFDNEIAICKKFNNWKNDCDAQAWLSIMGYTINILESVTAYQIPTRISKESLNFYKLNPSDYEIITKFKKADAQIRLIIKIGNILKIENISIKKANDNADYNQIDKRPVVTYQMMWGFDDELCSWLKLFTGATLPGSHLSAFPFGLKDSRRVFLNEMPKDIQVKIITFFSNNKILIVSDLIKGRGGLSANWFLVTKYHNADDTTEWFLTDINKAMNFFASGPVVISPRGSLSIGRITMQRKGGTPDPTSLQFKLSPNSIFGSC